MREVVRPTTLIESSRLSERLGAQVLIASETFQHTGSFKFRCAYNMVASVPNRLIVTASSGNFGQAVAYSAKLLGKRAIIVMPLNSAQVKVDAVRGYGATVDLIDVTKVKRADRVQRLIDENPGAYRASAYDDVHVIEGNATLGEEIAALTRDIDCIVAPMGGGGLTSGLVTAVRRSGRAIDVIAAEPALANDGARSLREGRIVSNDGEPQTIADGARTLSLGVHNWEILKDGLAGVVEVSEDNIRAGLRALFGLANLKAEPTGSLAIGALLEKPGQFHGKRVVCVVTGGNVDPAVYRDILST